MIENNESTERIIRINIEEEMKSAYIDYSMSVIVARALPDVRDGLKPVHRRILFGMDELGLAAGKPYKKSARIVGDVMGKYHPHGDSALYEAMVRMAQPWSLRYMLVDGQGNFGSVDGDGAAAMRYTEARLQKLTEEVLADLDKNTVDMTPNYSEEYKEPTVLASKAPLLLLNGASGIAVGMATNMPPHNLTEICNAICAYIDNPDITVEDLLQYIKGPDFPTGGTIYGYQGIKDAFETGRGRIVIRSKTNIEVADSGRETIVVNEIPYMVNKKELIQKIADLVEEKKIDGISYVNDESDRNGMRIVIKLKIGAVANVVLNTLFKYTPLQSTFSVNNIALVDGRPRQLNLIQLIKYFVKHRHEVVVRRAKYELEKAEKEAHILEGLLIALDHFDEVIALIRASKTPDEARTGLMARFNLTEIQSNAIVEMRLRQLTGLEHNKLKDEFAKLQQSISNLKNILADEKLQLQIVKDETFALRDKYGDERRTDIVHTAEEFNPEDFYADDDVVITISHMGYIKRTNLAEYRLQNRGGVGAKGSTTRDEDFIEHIYVANMHSTMLFFTQKGRGYWLKVYDIPEGGKATKGRAIQNVINIEPNDKVMAYINVKTLNDADYINNNYIVLCTKNGTVKKTSLEAYSRPRANGINAITIREGDELLEAILTNGQCEILLAGRNGKCVRFNESNVRAVGRTGMGVRGITIDETDEVIGMICVRPVDAMQQHTHIMVVSENGYGKRSELDDYRITNRGGKGVKTLNITEKTGKLIAIKEVTDENDLMIINKSGLAIRLAVADIRVTGRATQGVRLINIRGNDQIAAVCKVNKSDEKPEENEPAATETAE
ncbi:MAG: DNA gyrase subunit A [Prevotellaceae bacterium]|jgi:DNA gyrase subunit A|nr:DNA gyrase subunit A [Prevotellaceae bacterium]